MTKYLLIALMSLPAFADWVGGVNPSDLQPPKEENGPKYTFEHPVIERKMKIVEYDFGSPTNDPMIECQFHRYKSTGYTYIFGAYDPKTGFASVGSGFPSELLQLDQPLKEGFKNKAFISAYGVEGTYTAEFKNGVLTVIHEAKVNNIAGFIRARIVFKTKSSALDASEVSITYEGPRDTPGSTKANFRCADTPMA